MKWLLSASLCFLCEVLFAQQIVVKPYIQPGYDKSAPEKDQKLIVWFTDQTPGDFEVQFGVRGTALAALKPQRQALYFAPAKPAAKSAKKEKPAVTDPVEGPVEVDIIEEPVPLIPERDQYYFKYVTILTNLPLDTEIQYRVTLRGAVIREAAFLTRSTAEKSIRFIMVGDLANGKESQNEIAFQMIQTHPQFLVALGDIVYSAGRMSQYMNHFWPTYNQPASEGPKTGASIMASVPFYVVLGNHDVEEAKWPDYPDALAAYFVFYPGGEGPGLGRWNTPLGKNANGTAAFRRAVGKPYPGIANYSFDNGPAHFLVLDSASYAHLTNVALLSWIQNDLKNAKTPWKFVCFHTPAFHNSREHYVEQKMRRLEPLFERLGVDVVFSGHVHNYQRSKPLRFRPNSNYYFRAKDRVDGFITIDEAFDGISQTHPNGIIHIVTGGGGASLYSRNLDSATEYLRDKYPGNWARFTAKYYAAEHSFTLIELAPRHLLLRQINARGEEVDRMLVNKP